MNKQVYQGSCHCQAIQFELRCEPIENALQCNCSICHRKNAVMSKQTFDQQEFTLIQGKEQLSVYQWGDQDVNHYFCQRCGIYPFHNTAEQPDNYRINLLCIDGLPIQAIDITHFDGKHLL